MKRLMLALALMTLLNSCATTAYQVLETKSTDVKSNVFANQDVEIRYNFWSFGGAMNFRIYNLSAQPIYVDLDRSHFILNGESYDYYNEAEYTNSSTSSNSKSETNNSSTRLINLLATSRTSNSNTMISSASVKTRQKRIKEIPPQSGITITGYKLMQGKLFSCDLKKFKNDRPAVITFTKQDSPLQFRNYVSYSKNINFDSVEKIDNSFWLSQVSNLTGKDFNGKRSNPKDCNNKANPNIFIYEMPYKQEANFYFSFVQ